MNNYIDMIQQEIENLSDQQLNLKELQRQLDYEIQLNHQEIDTISRETDCIEDFFTPVEKKTEYNQVKRNQLIKKRDELEEKLKKAKEDYENLSDKKNSFVHIKKILFSDQKKLDIYDLINEQELERKRIANDIQELIVQNLSAVIAKNDFISSIVSSDIHRAKIEMTVMKNVIEQSMDDLREIIFTLHPMPTDDESLEKAFYHLITTISEQTQMNVCYQYDVKNVSINSNISICIIRIIHELCYNSMEHSLGTEISVRIKSDHHNLMITEEDNGVGFDVSVISDVYDEDNNMHNPMMGNIGFGLRMLKERVRMLNGDMSVDRREEGGIQFVIRIPLSEEGKSGNQHSYCR